MIIGLQAVYSLRYQPIAERDEEQDEQEDTASLVVEEPTHRHQKYITHMQTTLSGFAIHYQCENCIDNGKECPKIELGKEQRALTVKTKYMCDEIHLLIRIE